MSNPTAPAAEPKKPRPADADLVRRLRALETAKDKPLLLQFSPGIHSLPWAYARGSVLGRVRTLDEAVAKLHELAFPGPDATAEARP